AQAGDGGRVADARLVVGVVAAPETRPLAQQLRLLVVVLRGADQEERVRAALLADLEHLLRDLVVGLVPGNALPLAALELHRVLQAVRVVRHAVLAHRRALGAVRAEVDRGIEHRLLAHPDAVLHHGIDCATHGAVRTHGALHFELAFLGLGLGLADHAEGKLRSHGAGAERDARAPEERATVHGTDRGKAARKASLGNRLAGCFAGQQHEALLNLGGAVVVVDVLARVIAARLTLALVGRLWRGRILRYDRRGGCDAAGTCGEKEITAGKSLRALAHAQPPLD